MIKEILASLVSHYKKKKSQVQHHRYQSRVVPKVTNLDSHYLCHLPDKEVKEIMMQLLKTTGPNSLPAAFYQSSRGTIGEDVLSTNRSFFSTSSLPPMLNHTNIVLIPKVIKPRGSKRLMPYEPMQCGL